MLGAEFQVNTYTPGSQRSPAIGMESNGDFVITWDTATSRPASAYAAGASPLRVSGWAPSSLVNTYTTGGHYGSGGGGLADGDFVVIWTSYGQDDPTGLGIFAQRYDSSGARLGIEFQVNSYTVGLQYTPFAMGTGATLRTPSASTPTATSSWFGPASVRTAR